MAARTPPPEFSVRQYPSPNVLADQVVVVSVTTELANSNPIEPGTAHPDLRNFPGYKLGCTRVNPSDPYFSQRIYVSDQTNADWYSYALKYVSEANACPIFIRGYQERKDTYAPRTKNSALQVVYNLVLTGAGNGYTPGTQPLLTFSGGGGTGAAGHAIVSPLGAIAQLVLTSGGSAYTSNPTFTIAAPPSGTTATGTASIQPTGAVLVSEEAQLYPPDSEFYALYFNVLRVYQTLPGPILHGQTYNRQFGFSTPYTLQDTAAGANLGDDATEITPKDSVQQEVKKIDLSLLLSIYGSYIITWPDVTDLPLPDVLTGIQSIKNSNFGEGAGSGSGSAGATGDHGSYSLSIPSSNQSSAALSYELLIKISSGRDRGRGKRCRRGVFLMLTPFNDADLLAQISLLLGTTVNYWPDFRPDFESLVVTGMSVAVQTEANGMVHLSYDSSSSSSGSTSETSYSYKMGITSGPVRISPTIHGSVSITGDGTSATQEVTSESEVTISGTASAHAGPISKSATATATVKPTSLSATGGQATYPTTGFYFTPSGINSEIFEEGWVMVHFEVADFGLLFGSGATVVSLAPVFIQPAGNYSIPAGFTFRLAIHSPDETSQIRYTTDGSTPTAGSAGHGTLIAKNRGYVNLPIGTTTLKAIAWTGDVTAASSVVTGVYVISAL